MSDLQKYILGFVVMCMVQWLVIGRMVYQNQHVVSSGTTLKFQVAPVDPTDPFRGKFVALSFVDNDFEVVDTTEKWMSGQSIFVTFDTTDAGFAYIDQIFPAEPPTSKAYLRVWIERVSSSGRDRTIYIHYPFDRFYLQESKAPMAEAQYQNVTASRDAIAWAEVSISQGKGILLDVLLEGKSLNALVAKTN